MTNVWKFLTGKGRWELRYPVLVVGTLLTGAGVYTAVEAFPWPLQLLGGGLAAFLSLVVLPSWLAYSGN